MLCELAHSFPPRVAELLERDRGLKRNFREESITDVLMASLVGLEPFGIRVDFPDEPTTGGDMEWIFVAPLELNGGRYLRLILQAKRAQFAKLKVGGYWYYHHLDHGTPAGHQAQTLVGHSASAASEAAFPLYAFYHPTSALRGASGALPAIEGINLVFAQHVAPIVKGGCGRAQKRVDHWRKHFMPLSDILCWPAELLSDQNPDTTNTTQLMIDGMQFDLPAMTGGFHPDIVAARLNSRESAANATAGRRTEKRIEAQVFDRIPAALQRAIAGEVSREDRMQLNRPRVVLSTRLRRDDPAFLQAQELSKR